MRWQLSEEQNAYRQSFGAWLADVAPREVVRRWLDSGDAAEFAGRLVRDGWAGVGVPEALGGQGGGLVELALTAELLAGASAPSATWLATALAVPALGSGTDAAAFEGEHAALLSPADAIPGAGPRLTMDGEGLLHGRVPRVLAGDLAAWFVAAADGPGGSPRLRLVPASAGVQTQSRRLLDRTRSVGDVAIEGAPSPPLDIVDAPEFQVAGLRPARAAPSWWPRTRWERWRGCSTLARHRVQRSQRRQFERRSARSRPSSTPPRRSWSRSRQPGRRCTSPRRRSTLVARSRRCTRPP